MRIDNITINLVDDDWEESQIHLGNDSGDDMYPNIELSDDVKKKIEEIRKIVWDSQSYIPLLEKNLKLNLIGFGIKKIKITLENFINFMV